MKARVKATGEIVEVDFHLETKRGKQFGVVTDTKRLFKPCRDYRKFYQDELEFISPEDTEVVDYWDKLLHQYAGMAMQAYIIAAHISQFSFCENDMKDCVSMATALVEKLKNNTL